VSLLVVAMTLLMLLAAVGFVTGGLLQAEGVLWGSPAKAGTPHTSRTRKVGAMLLIAIGGILVVTALVTAGLIAEREAHFIGLQATVSRLETRIQALERKLGQ
jgi:hypothetical protein